MARQTDYIKPTILVQAGIVTASVAILVALIAGTSGKDNDLYRPVFAHAMAPMAITVVLSTISVGVLQALRYLWQIAPDAKRDGNFGWVHKDEPRALFRLSVLFVFIASIYLTAAPGVEAAKELVTGTLNIVGNKCAEQYLSAQQREAVPWFLRRFYRGGPTAQCRG
jgi:hypothetical protein